MSSGAKPDMKSAFLWSENLQKKKVPILEFQPSLCSSDIPNLFGTYFRTFHNNFYFK